MDYVNFQVAIGGDVGNTVPKFFVPVSEVPVLMALHGPDALTEFEQIEAPEDAEDLSNRDELTRLASIYGHVKDRDGNPLLPQVYAGAGARVITSIDDLEIPEGAFKVLARAKPRTEEKPKDKPAKSTRPKATKAPVAVEGEAGEDDGDANEDGIDTSVLE